MLPEEPTEAEFLACQIGSWYPLVPKSSTFRTIILDDLPEPEFTNYLSADQVILPPGVKTSSALLEQAAAASTRTFESDDDEDSGSSDEGSSSSDVDMDEKQQKEGANETCSSTSDDNETTRAMMMTVMMHEMKELSQRIETAITTLGGAVLPKLNWSSPKDATWINGGTLECRRAGDVLLLLKSSDFVSHDLVQLQSQQSRQMTATLALRKWANLHPSQEYRCFCRDQALIGICQRHYTEYWSHLSQPQHQATIQQVIVAFFRNVLLPSTSSSSTTSSSVAELSNFVFDVYVDRKHRVWLVDLNVWGTCTDSLLFDWNELVEMKNNGSDESNHVDFRVVEQAVNVQAHPLSNYKAPVDVLDFASDSRQFREFMSMCERPGDRVTK